MLWQPWQLALLALLFQTMAAGSAETRDLAISIYQHDYKICGLCTPPWLQLVQLRISALHCLQEVANALRLAGMLGGRQGRQGVELYFDSGVRSGRDALKALCLGAQAVGIGRPYYWASACHGEDGVVALLQMFTEELQHSMAQLGTNNLGQLAPDCLCCMQPAPCKL